MNRKRDISMSGKNQLFQRKIIRRFTISVLFSRCHCCCCCCHHLNLSLVCCIPITCRTDNTRAFFLCPAQITPIRFYRFRGSLTARHRQKITLHHQKCVVLCRRNRKVDWHTRHNRSGKKSACRHQSICQGTCSTIFFPVYFSLLIFFISRRCHSNTHTHTHVEYIDMYTFVDFVNVFCARAPISFLHSIIIFLPRQNWH